ncbi:hypothetical protein BDZ97DRAFT_1975552 [Flammula alnicola]|nr:hypothetical protein BDZ97DRAFT_1975552 [Flammula alnicola]
MPSRVPLRYRHWTYVWIPIATAAMWFCTLLAMLITWLASGRPKYPSQDGSIAYISDVGADVLKPLFITGCAITGVGFFLSLLVERILRHTGRLMPNMRKRERVFSILAILGSFIAHRVFLLVFIVGVGLSAIFSIIEYRWLKIAYIAKAIIASTLILLAIAFAVALFKATTLVVRIPWLSSSRAILEWTIAFGFTLYLLTFWYDLKQSKGVEKGELKALVRRNNPTPENGPPNMSEVA